MLNITENKIADTIDLEEYQSFKLLRKSHIQRVLLMLGLALLSVLFVMMFLPWTQNISSKGYVTTRLPEQRPQAIQSVIGGRLEKWYVREGDFVEKGDTIIFLSEVKSDYFDPDLVKRTSEQVDAKSQSINSYEAKVKALQKQYKALQKGLILKREQTKNKIKQAYNKVQIDSIDLVAFRVKLEIAKNQLSRTKALYAKGLKTLTALQEKELKLQSASAKVSVQQNKLLNQRNNLINLSIGLDVVEQEYADKLAKSQSNLQTALSAKLESVAATSKLRNKLSNYHARKDFYYVKAPQAGYITKAIKKGIGETIKAGTDIVSIMPFKYDLAVEVYLAPQDLPLLNIGNQVRLRFDGWPAIVISGWPKASTGVFSGEIVVIDRFISSNGAYRVLVSPTKNQKIWPEELRIGTGVYAFVLLKEVPIWYEIWRRLNGFPTDYYQQKDKKTKAK